MRAQGQAVRRDPDRAHRRIGPEGHPCIAERVNQRILDWVAFVRSIENDPRERWIAFDAER